MPEEINAQNQNNESQRPAVPANANPTSNEGQTRTDTEKRTSMDKNPHWADRTIAIFTVLIFLTYLTSNYFACQTLREIKIGGADTHDLAVAAGKQADASRIIAEAAKAQADASRRLADQSFIQSADTKKLTLAANESTRGRIAIKRIRFQAPLTDGQKIVMLVETENVGHAAAFERGAQGSAHWAHIPDGPMPIKMPRREEGTLAEPGSSGLILVIDKTPVTSEFISGISKPGRDTAFFFGRIVYETLGMEHFTEFCAYVMPYDTTTTPESDATAGFKTDPRFALRQCDKWHSAN